MSIYQFANRPSAEGVQSIFREEFEQKKLIKLIVTERLVTRTKYMQRCSKECADFMKNWEEVKISLFYKEIILTKENPVIIVRCENSKDYQGMIEEFRISSGMALPNLFYLDFIIPDKSTEVYQACINREGVYASKQIDATKYFLKLGVPAILFCSSDCLDDFKDYPVVEYFSRSEYTS